MSELTGRALAEAAAGVMGNHVDNIFSDWASGEMLESLPDQCADFDYLCLEWAREHWQGKPSTHRAQWLRFRAVLGDHGLEDYEPGIFARALVAASKEGA